VAKVLRAVLRRAARANWRETVAADILKIGRVSSKHCQGVLPKFESVKVRVDGKRETAEGNFKQGVANKGWAFVVLL